MESTHFNTSFSANNFEDWKKKLIKELKIEDYNQALRTDRNGIEIAPIYHQRTTALESTYRTLNDWAIVNQYDVDNNEAAINQRILADLNDGVSGLRLNFIQAHADIPTLLKDIDLNAITTICSYHDERIANELGSYFKSVKLGHFHVDAPSIYHVTHDILHINGLAYNNAGANTVTELSSLLSQINEALHQHTDISTLKALSISIAVDTHFFEQISKLRALRILAQHVLKSYQLDIPVFIHSQTSQIYLTRRDVNNNLIRNTIAGMAGVLGGSDSIHILAHDLCLHEHISTADQRLAKNQQLLFKEESHLQDIINAADGSYFIDYYTQEIAHKAYAAFQKIEREEGWLAQLDTIKHRISLDQVQLIQSYVDKKNTLIGINKYPNTMEDIHDTWQPTMSWQGIQYVNLENEIIA